MLNKIIEILTQKITPFPQIQYITGRAVKSTAKRMDGHRKDYKMNELITVTYDSDRPTVLGRELHEKLEINSNYTTWFNRMCEYGFSENEDYVVCFPNLESENRGGQNKIDHQLTIDMAKQICMIQRSDAGRRYREYFLEVERKWNSPEAIMGRALKIAETQLAAAKGQIAELAPKAAYFDKVADCTGLTSFRETAKLFGVKECDFIKFTEDHRLCYRNSHSKLIPYADYMKRGWFEVKEVTYSSRGEQKTTLYTKITPTGRTRIFEKMKKAGVL